MDWLGPSTAKLGHAKKHRDRLDKKIQRFLEGDPYPVTIHVDYQTTQYEGRVHEKERPDLVLWGLILGDALYNIRCALDYLAYALTILETNQDPPPKARHIYFPLVAESKDWASMKGSQIPHVGGNVQDAIETLQPYHGADDPTIKNRVGDHPFELLRVLNNADKHSVSPFLVTMKGQGAIYSTSGTGNPFIDAEHDEIASRDLLSQVDTVLKDGAVVAKGAFRITGPNPEVKMYGQVTPTVMLKYERPGFPGPFGSSTYLDHPVAGLDRILSFVDEEVFGRIARALQP